VSVGVKIFVSILAGLGAGVGTGFAGMSAAAVISPMLIIFLKLPAYDAIGIALASDVLASAISAASYGKNKKIDLNNGSIMMFVVMVFAIVGSFFGQLMPDNEMGVISLVMMLILGVKFLIKPIMAPKAALEQRSRAKMIFFSVLCGIPVGFVCGFVGAGGGMMMLLVLTVFLGYGLKTAVGTSVFIMTFTALTGALTHFWRSTNEPDWACLITCVVSTLAFAWLSSLIANRSDPKLLNRIVGVVLLIIGATMTVFKLVIG